MALRRPTPVDQNALKEESCTFAYLQLQSELALHQLSLPQYPVEPPSIALSWRDPGNCCIRAPSFPPGHSLAIINLQKHVHRERAASFVLALRSTGTCDVSGTILTALASAVLVNVALTPSASSTTEASTSSTLTPDPVPLLPVNYEPSVEHEGVLISVHIPPSISDGSRIRLQYASVAGCAVPLSESHVETIVGFNHAPEVAGLVSNAACHGDSAALQRLLADGASTEERNAVSTSNPTVLVNLRSPHTIRLIKTQDGWTPLIWAAVKGYYGTVKVLLDCGAALEAEDIDVSLLHE
jgi:hypothetical protein